MLQILHTKALCSMIILAGFGLAAPYHRARMHSNKTETCKPQANHNSTSLPSSGNPYNFTYDTHKLRFDKHCSAQQVNDILFGWAEAGYLAGAFSKWDPWDNHNYWDAVDLYMGTKSHQNTNGSDLSAIIANNVRRNFRLHQHQWPEKTLATVYCNWQEIGLNHCLLHGVVAYTYTPKGHSRGGTKNHKLVVCDLYHQLPSLSQVVNATRKDMSFADDICNMYPTKGHVLLHESFHLAKTVSIPPVGDAGLAGQMGVYGPPNVEVIAKTENTRSMCKIADAYSITAAAIFAMDTFGLTEAPTPRQVPCRSMIMGHPYRRLNLPTIEESEDEEESKDVQSPDDCILSEFFPGSSAMPEGSPKDYCVASATQLGDVFRPAEYLPFT